MITCHMTAITSGDLSTRLRTAEGNKSEGVFAATSSTVRPMPLLVAHRKCVVGSLEDLS